MVPGRPRRSGFLPFSIMEVRSSSSKISNNAARAAWEVQSRAPLLQDKNNVSKQQKISAVSRLHQPPALLTGCLYANVGHSCGIQQAESTVAGADLSFSDTNEKSA